jgi:hypothetical protein
MEASASFNSPLPPTHKSTAGRMTADRIANNNELHAHTNPLNLTFPKHLGRVDLELYEAAVEGAETSLLVQEHDPKETSAHPISTGEFLTRLNPSSYFAPLQLCPSSTQVPATQCPNSLPQMSPLSFPNPRDVNSITTSSYAIALEFELGLKELKANLGEIVILRDHITAQDTKISKHASELLPE